MKKTIYTLLGLLLAAGLTSCQDWFIEKPEVTGMDQDEVFSTAKNAEGRSPRPTPRSSLRDCPYWCGTTPRSCPTRRPKPSWAAKTFAA